MILAVFTKWEEYQMGTKLNWNVFTAYGKSLIGKNAFSNWIENTQVDRGGMVICISIMAGWPDCFAGRNLKKSGVTMVWLTRTLIVWKYIRKYLVKIVKVWNNRQSFWKNFRIATTSTKSQIHHLSPWKCIEHGDLMWFRIDVNERVHDTSRLKTTTTGMTLR